MENVIGDQWPRLESVPQYTSSKASDAIALGEVAGLYLDPWQKHCITGALGVGDEGKWTSFEVKILVSRQNGKGSILEVRELAGLYLFPSDRLLIHTAHEHKTSNEHFRRVWGLVSNTPELSRYVVRHSEAYGREFIELKAMPTIIMGSGGRQVKKSDRKRLIFIARSTGSGRGFTGDYVNYDEDMFLDAGKIGASIPSLRARPNPQIWYTGSAGLRTSSQLAKVRRRGVAAAEGLRPPGRLCFYEWSIVPHDEYCLPTCVIHDDPYEIRSIAKANPALGIRIDNSREYLDSEADAMGGYDSEEYLREICGVGTYPLDEEAWLVIPETWYRQTLDTTDNPPRVRHPVFAVDAAPDRSSAAIAVCGARPDGKIGVQVVEHQAGTGWLFNRIVSINNKWHPIKWIIDRRAAAGTLIDDLEKAGVPVEVIGATEVAYSCGQMFDAFRDNDRPDALRHYGQEMLRKAIAGVDKRKLGEAWAFDRLNSATDISPLMAVTFAYYGYLRFGVEPDYDVADTLDGSAFIRAIKAGAYGREDIQRLLDRELITVKELEDAGISI